MLVLDKAKLVGKGCHQECYRHPKDKELCIKILVSGKSIENEREKKYHKHLAKRSISWEMLPKYHGEVETNLGIGSVYDLVQDYTGEVSKNLKFYLFESEELQKHCEALAKALAQFKEYLLQQCIITRDLLPENIVCQRVNCDELKLHVVDNIGNSDFIPICNYSKFFARQKINRKWERFKRYLHKAGVDSNQLFG